MPVDKSLYPDNWDEIRNQILLRAGGENKAPAIGACCEDCGVRNYSVGFRNNGTFRLLSERNTYEAARSLADVENLRPENAAHKIIVIVLTIAHINDPDPMNCDPENLKALCQRCHNILDMPMRIRNRQESKLPEGWKQLEFFE